MISKTTIVFATAIALSFIGKTASAATSKLVADTMGGYDALADQKNFKFRSPPGMESDGAGSR